MRHRLAWGLGLLLLLFGSHGSWLNDEDDQATAFWNLSHGSLRVVDTPAEFYRYNEDVSYNARFASTGIPVGSTLLNILALPVAGAIRLVDAMAPLWLVLSVAAVACFWGTTGWRWPWAPTEKVSLSWLPFLGLVVAATMGFRASSPDQDLFYPYSALQAVSAMAWAGGLLLTWRLLRTHMPNAYARTAVLLAVGLGPWMFWAQSAKYHSLTAFLAILLCWLRGGRPALWRHLALGLVVGLAVWSYPGPGLIAIVALAIVELPTVWVERRSLLRLAQRWAAIALGLVIGVTPFVVENAVLTGSPWTPPLFAAGQVTNQTLLEKPIPASAPGWFEPFRHVGWTTPAQHASDLAHILTTGKGIEGNPTGLLMLSPLLLFGFVGAWKVVSRRVRSPAADLALSMFVAQAILLTHAATVQGAGRDVRMWLPAVPCLGLLAGIGASNFLASLDKTALRRSCLIATASVLVALAVCATAVALHYDFGGGDYEHHLQNFLLGWAGLTVAGGALAWALGFVVKPARALLPTLIVGLGLAMPLLWSAVYMWPDHTVLVGDEQHTGGGMFVAALDPFTAWFRSKVMPAYPGFIVFDLVTGNLTYHPDYGTCTPVSNPCPSSYPVPQWVKDHPLYEGPL